MGWTSDTPPHTHTHTMYVTDLQLGFQVNPKKYLEWSSVVVAAAVIIVEIVSDMGIRIALAL